MSFFSSAKKIWLMYGLALLLLASALAWFSWTTIRLDQELETKRRQMAIAEREAIEQERISYALWRMDWLLTPLVAQEAARNHWMYESSIPISTQSNFQSSDAQQQAAQSNEQAEQEPNGLVQSDSLDQVRKQASAPPLPLTSPLVMRPSPFVKLHFQIDEVNDFTSPQVPDEQVFQFVCAQGFMTPTELGNNRAKLNQISNEFQFGSLLSACSDETLPEIELSDLVWNIEPSGTQNGVVETNQTEQLSKGELFENSYKGKEKTPNDVLSITKNGKLADFDSRAATANKLAYSQRFANSAQIADPVDRKVVEGVMRAIWYKGKLLLARKVKRGRKLFIQGCWLDWEAIRESLLKEISDIVPNADLVPRDGDAQVESNRALATIPVDLSLRPPKPTDDSATPAESSTDDLATSNVKNWEDERSDLPTSPMLSRTAFRSLAIAWGGFLLASLSTAWLIAGVIQLSERRSAFASAVTHELRTPLTTFRLYSEMLDTEMVNSPEQRQAYTKGLVAEADRLTRLVENVLQFSRLERNQGHVKKASISALELFQDVIDRCRPRLASAKLDLELNLDKSLVDVKLETSRDTVEQIVFNLIDNACKYATNGEPGKIQVEGFAENQQVVLRIRDFGPGLDRKMVRRLFRPFARSCDETAGTAAGVGLGLSLSRQLARQLGGKLTYRAANPGCIFELKLKL